MPYILAYSDQTSGAECIAPVIKLLQKKVEVLVVAKELAKGIFEKSGISFVEMPEFSEYGLFRLIRDKGTPSLLLISSTCLPHVDMTENNFRAWAAKNKIPSLAVLDQWHNYALRFSDMEGSLNCLPDKIAVPDELAKSEAIEEGIPAEKIIVTGQPYLESLLSAKPKDDLRKKLGIGNAKLIVFASESVRRVYGSKRGFDECSALKNVMDALAKVAASDIVLAIKPHPRNIEEDFTPVQAEIERVRERFPVFFLKGEDGHDTIFSADIIIGMTSIFLAEAMLLGKPVISVRIGAKEKDLFIGTKLHAIPLVKTQEELEEIMHQLLYDRSFLEKYLDRQRLFALTQKNAAENIAKLALGMAKL